MSKAARQLYEFGPFRVDAARRLLLKDSKTVSVAPKAFEILLVLLQNSGRVIEKDELMSKVWPDTVVEENNLTVNMSALRRALGESKGEHRYIVTIPGRGYQFAADVRELWDERADLILREQTLSRLVIEEQQDRKEEQNGSAGIGAGHIAPVASASVSHRFRWGTRSLIVFALMLAIAIASYVWMSNKPKQSEGGARPRSIAVLPFKPLAAANRDESLEMGMADSLIFRLSGIRGVVVRPISAVRKYADLNQDPLAAGREQQVDAVLDSSIQMAGGKVRVTARLVRVADGSVLWTGKSDEPRADPLTAQDAIAEKLAGSLALRLTDEERGRLTKRYTENPEAYQLYLKGRYFSEKRTRDGITKGIEYLQQAIDKDPVYALAYAGLAESYMLLRRWAFASVRDTVPHAKAAAEKALRLDDSLAEAHTALGRVKELSLDWSGAGAEYRRAIELNPNSEAAHNLYAMHLAALGRLDEAMAEIRRAQELNPLSLIINMEVGRIFFLMRQYDQAIAQYQKTLEMDPNFELARFNLGLAYEQKGMYQEAIAEYQKVIVPRIETGIPRIVRVHPRVGRVYALSGKRREAQKVLDELKEQSKISPGGRVSMAVIHAGLGENEQAIALLEKALDEGESDFWYFIGVHPMWDSLRSEPRFQDLLRRLGLPQ